MGGTVIPPNATDAGQILGEALNGLLGSLGTDGLAGAVAQIHRQPKLDDSLTDLRLVIDQVAQLTATVDALRTELAPVLRLVTQVVAIPKVAKALRG